MALQCTNSSSSLLPRISLLTTYAGLTRITFPGYTHEQLMSIIQSRLANVPGNIVHPDAIQFASRKVAAVSGDARRALDICRRAVELAEAASITNRVESTSNSAPNTPSKTPGRAKPTPAPQNSTTTTAKAPIVTIQTIKQAIAEATSSPLQQHLRSLPLSNKLFLAALLARVRRTGIAEAVLGDVLDEAKNLAAMSGADAISDFLLAGATLAAGDGDAALDALEALGGPGAGAAAQQRSPLTPRRGRPPAHAGEGRGSNAKAKAMKAARVVGMGSAAVELMEAGIVGLEARRGERVGRVRLGVSDEEVRLALREDDEVKGLGFG